MNEIQTNFALTQEGDTSHVERTLKFGADEITLKLSIKPTTGKDTTLNQLHVASLEIAIQHLQALLSKAPKK